MTFTNRLRSEQERAFIHSKLLASASHFLSNSEQLKFNCLSPATRAETRPRAGTRSPRSTYPGTRPTPSCSPRPAPAGRRARCATRRTRRRPSSRRASRGATAAAAAPSTRTRRPRARARGTAPRTRRPPATTAPPQRVGAAATTTRRAQRRRIRKCPRCGGCAFWRRRPRDPRS